LADILLTLLHVQATAATGQPIIGFRFAEVTDLVPAPSVPSLLPTSLTAKAVSAKPVAVSAIPVSTQAVSAISGTVSAQAVSAIPDAVSPSAVSAMAVFATAVSLKNLETSGDPSRDTNVSDIIHDLNYFQE
jgi:hypothetical protein